MADIQALLEQRRLAYNQHHPAVLAAGYAEDAVVTSPMFPHAEGRTEIERSFVRLFRVFPDWEMTFEDPCFSGSRVMQACQVRATQSGDFMGIPGTGRHVEFDCVLILDLHDGLIRRERRIYDFTGLLIKLGVLRGKPAI